MSGKTVREIRAIHKANVMIQQSLRKKRSQLYADFLDTARRMPFKHRWTLAINILRGQRKAKKVQA
jgi:hypothetical protein